MVLCLCFSIFHSFKLGKMFVSPDFMLSFQPEWITGGYDWNHVQFNARLFRTWLSGATTPVPWPREHTWVWSSPPNTQPSETLDLRDFCRPQSFMLRLWNAPKPGLVLKLFRMYVTFLVLGLVFLTWVVLRTLTEQRIATAREFAAVGDSAVNS
jgi:hypothetical protein